MNKTCFVLDHALLSIHNKYIRHKNNRIPIMTKLSTHSILCLFLFITIHLQAQNPKLTLDLTKPGANVSPSLYGLMTEEINHSYDGGLYAELIRNRIFKDNPNTPEAWSVIQEGGAKASIQLVAANPTRYLPSSGARQLMAR